MGVFFVNSQQNADMLRRANRKVEVQNLGTVSSKKICFRKNLYLLFFKLGIMVSQASCPAPLLDEDLRRHFKVNISTKNKRIFFFLYRIFRILCVIVDLIPKHFN